MKTIKSLTRNKYLQDDSSKMTYALFFFYKNMITIMVNAEFPKVDFDIQKGIWEEMTYTIFKVYFECSVIHSYHKQKR